MAAQNPNGSLSTTIENKIATVEFGHPASNSFPSQLLDSLTQELKVLSGNKKVSVIVLRSMGEGLFVRALLLMSFWRCQIKSRAQSFSLVLLI
jgi:methylglutaconyl-CoA hydratase